MSDSTWTPARGIIRAIAVGIAAAILVSLLLGVVAVLAPAVLLNAFCRAFISFGVGWLLFGVVQAAAGMVGGPVTWIATRAAALVMLSNHAAWAIFGVPIGDGGALVTGWSYWFDPALVCVMGVSVVVPLAICAALCRDGAPGADVFVHIAALPLWGTHRS